MFKSFDFNLLNLDRGTINPVLQSVDLDSQTRRIPLSDLSSTNTESESWSQSVSLQRKSSPTIGKPMTNSPIGWNFEGSLPQP